MKLLLALLLAMDGGGKDAPLITVPSAVSAEVGDPTTIVAMTDGKAVVFFTPTPGLSLVPASALKDAKSTIFVGKRPGTYEVWAITSFGDVPTQPVKTVVTITAPPPPPLPPDPFVATLQAAYTAETDAAKVPRLAWLAAVFDQAQSVLAMPDVETTQDVLAKVSGGIHSAKGFPQGGMPKMMAVLKDEMAKALGTPQALTPELKTSISAELARIAKALQGVK